MYVIMLATDMTAILRYFVILDWGNAERFAEQVPAAATCSATGNSIEQCHFLLLIIPAKGNLMMRKKGNVLINYCF